MADAAAVVDEDSLAALVVVTDADVVVSAATAVEEIVALPDAWEMTVVGGSRPGERCRDHPDVEVVGAETEDDPVVGPRSL